MWALAYYNFKSNNILISRDRFGEKPLYYYKSKEGFYLLVSFAAKKFIPCKAKSKEKSSFGSFYSKFKDFKLCLGLVLC